MRFLEAETFEVICQEFGEVTSHKHSEDHREHYAYNAEEGPRDFQDLAVSNLLGCNGLLLPLRLLCWVGIEAAWKEEGRHTGSYCQYCCK